MFSRSQGKRSIISAAQEQPRCGLSAHFLPATDSDAITRRNPNLQTGHCVDIEVLATQIRISLIRSRYSAR